MPESPLSGSGKPLLVCLAMLVECRMTLPSDVLMSHVVVGLRGCASRSRRGHYATKFAAAKLRFVPADEC